MVAKRQATAIVSCPVGKRMSGGGGECYDAGMKGYTFVKESGPIGDGTAWQLRCDSWEDQNVMARVSVICD